MTINQLQIRQLKINEFLEHVYNVCKEWDIELCLRDRSRVVYSQVRGQKTQYSSGYFCPSTKRLVSALNRTDWLQILMHEFCHLEQWIQSKESPNCKIAKIWAGGLDADDDKIFFDKTKKMNKELIERVNNQLRLELDCEKRTIKNFKKYGLYLNVKGYIQRANSYIALYGYMKKSRRWPDDKPYEEAGVWSKMPSTFQKEEFYINPSKKYIKIFEEYGI